MRNGMAAQSDHQLVVPDAPPGLPDLQSQVSAVQVSDCPEPVLPPSSCSSLGRPPGPVSCSVPILSLSALLISIIEAVHVFSSFNRRKKLRWGSQRSRR